MAIRKMPYHNDKITGMGAIIKKIARRICTRSTVGDEPICLYKYHT